MSEKIINSLRDLRSVKMDADRQAVQRDFLLSQISQGQSNNLSGVRLFFSYFNQPLIYKPIAYISAILLLLLAGTSYTMSAASHSLPGNTFYPVKLSWEKLQLSLVPDEVDKTKKQIEYADRRLTELTTVADDLASPLDKQAKVAEAVRHFNDSIREAKNSLEKAASQADGTNDDLLAVAKLVNDKSNDFEQVLVGHYPDLPVTVKSVVEKEVADIKYQSLELLVSRYVSNDSSVSKDLISQQLEEKLIAYGEWVSQLDDEEISQSALAKLNDLQELLDKEEFSQVLAGLNDFMAWQDTVLNPAETDTDGGEVLGVDDVLDIELGTTTTTSTEPISQSLQEQVKQEAN